MARISGLSSVGGRGSLLVEPQCGRGAIDHYAETPDTFILLSGDKDVSCLTLLPNRGVQEPGGRGRHPHSAGPAHPQALTQGLSPRPGPTQALRAEWLDLPPMDHRPALGGRTDRPRTVRAPQTHRRPDHPHLLRNPAHLINARELGSRPVYGPCRVHRPNPYTGRQSPHAGPRAVRPSGDTGSRAQRQEASSAVPERR